MAAHWILQTVTRTLRTPGTANFLGDSLRGACVSQERVNSSDATPENSGKSPAKPKQGRPRTEFTPRLFSRE